MNAVQGLCALVDDGPFVLIDGSATRCARLYRGPIEVFRPRSAEALENALDRIRLALAANLHVAGCLTYAAGASLVGLNVARAGDQELAWFGIFTSVDLITNDQVAALLPMSQTAIGTPQPRLSKAEYIRAFEQAQDLIRAGDIYQVNLTYLADVHYNGSPASLYRHLRHAARAPHAALVWTGSVWLASLSPELFFSVAGDTVSARPMKGTARRGTSLQEDQRLAHELVTDVKQRAENLMIVDLLRNDLSRVCKPGTVRVPRLFTLETFPTIHQMTSTIEGSLAPGFDAVDVLRCAFPCGSITGAPKKRAMEIIDMIENERRGYYCGSIGYFDPGGDAVFNVAIRTLECRDDRKIATLGLGSAIVADSCVDEEWSECLTKARFLLAT